MEKKQFVVCMILFMPLFKSGAIPVPNLFVNEEKDNPWNESHLKNGVSISYQEQLQSVSITFNESCENAEIIIYKDGVPVANEVLDNVEMGTVEVYAVDESDDSVITTQVVVDGKDVWISEINQISK